MPVAAFSHDALGVRVVLCASDLNRKEPLELFIRDSSQRAGSDFRPVPVVDDEDERVLERRLNQTDAVIVIMLIVRAIEEKRVESTARAVVDLAKICLNQPEVRRNTPSELHVLEELLFRTAKFRPIVNAGHFDVVSVHGGTGR